ncbi:kinase-like protein [Rickenella mellea]|uniref:Kinase-like protein n=1 Tax=Rickenella mellea TaxID=50990 RepID=A0A4Y7QAM2_9AGAM|nr:kinase-like protein [Rickenella mellea]
MKSSKHTARKLLLHEARIWCKLRHSHILELDGFAHLGSMENVVLVSKLCPFGDLRDYINEKYPSKRQKTRLLWQAADAVKYLHNIGIIHGDLRGEKYNGSSLHNGSKLSQKRWMAYELLEQSTPAPLGEVTEEQDYYGVNESTDIYAFGCLTLEVLLSHALCTVHLELTCGISQGITGEDPYVGVDDDDLLEMKQAKLCPKRPDHSDIDQDLWDLMKKCWNANPHDRGSAADIYEVLKNGWPSQRRERPESQ